MRTGGFGFNQQFGFGPASQSAGAAAPPAGQASWPFTLVGVEADWAFTASARWEDTYVIFDDTGTASLTGGAVATFDAAVSDSTACTVTLKESLGGSNGTVTVTMKGGTPVNFTFTGTPNQEVTQTVTSGILSGFVLAAIGIFPSNNVYDIDISLA